MMSVVEHTSFIMQVRTWRKMLTSMLWKLHNGRQVFDLKSGCMPIWAIFTSTQEHKFRMGKYSFLKGKIITCASFFFVLSNYSELIGHFTQIVKQGAYE